MRNLALLCLFSALSPAAHPADPQILEVPEPSVESIHIEALIKLPALDAHEMAAAQVLARTLADGTDEYTPHQILAYGAQLGIRPRVSIMPDHLRVRLVMPEGQMVLAASIMDSVLRRPVFPDESVRQNIELMPFLARSAWEEALEPFSPNFSRLRRADVIDFHRRYFRPENLTLAVGGAFTPGDGRAEFQRRFEDWQPLRVLARHDAFPPRPTQVHRQRITTIDLWGKFIPSDDPLLAHKLAALSALGVGKHSTVYKIFREREGWSYRQEALLWPVSDGFAPRVILAHVPHPEEQARAVAMRAAILEAIEGWNFEDRDRALAMAETVLIHGLELEPWRLTLMPTVNDPIERRTFMRAYWHLKTGLPFNAQSLLQTMRDLTVDELKSAAKEMMEDARPRLISGRAP